MTTITSTDAKSYYFIHIDGYTVTFNYDKYTSLWCAACYELGVLGQGKTKVEALKDFGLALVDMMDSYTKDGIDLP